MLGAGDEGQHLLQAAGLGPQGALELRQQTSLAVAADAAQVGGDDHRQDDGAEHPEGELDQIGDHHPADAAERGVDHRHQDAAGDHRRRRHVEEGAADLDHGGDHPGHGQAVDEHPGVDRLEAAQHRRRAAAVAQLDDLGVGDHPRAPPQPGEEEGRRQVGQRPAPPDPVAGDAARGDDAGDRQRRVGGEGGGDDRGAGQPPGKPAVGDEEAVDPGRRAAAEGDPQRYREADVENDDRPVDRLEGDLHRPRLQLFDLVAQGGQRGLRPRELVLHLSQPPALGLDEAGVGPDRLADPRQAALELAVELGGQARHQA